MASIRSRARLAMGNRSLQSVFRGSKVTFAGADGVTTDIGTARFRVDKNGDGQLALGAKSIKVDWVPGARVSMRGLKSRWPASSRDRSKRASGKLPLVLVLSLKDGLGCYAELPSGVVALGTIQRQSGLVLLIAPTVDSNAFIEIFDRKGFGFRLSDLGNENPKALLPKRVDARFLGVVPRERRGRNHRRAESFEVKESPRLSVVAVWPEGHRPRVTRVEEKEDGKLEMLLPISDLLTPELVRRAIERNWRIVSLRLSIPKIECHFADMRHVDGYVVAFEPIRVIFTIRKKSRRELGSLNVLFSDGTRIAVGHLFRKRPVCEVIPQD